MKRILARIAAAALIVPAALLAGAPAASAQETAATLTAIRAQSHTGYDRMIFQFSGAIPTRLSVRYVPQLIADPSGKPLAVTGRAILEASLYPATAHDSNGNPTAPERLVFSEAFGMPSMPQMKSVVQAGDFESVLSYGIGLAHGAPFNVGTLANPSRVIVDVSTRANGRANSNSKNIGTSGWVLTAVANPSPGNFTGSAVVQSRTGTKTWNQTEIEVQMLNNRVWRGLSWTHLLYPGQGKAIWSARTRVPTAGVNIAKFPTIFPGAQFRTWAWAYVMAPDHKWQATAVLSPVYTVP